MSSQIRRPKQASEKLDWAKSIPPTGLATESVRTGAVDLKLGKDSRIIGCVLEEGCSVELEDGAFMLNCYISTGCHIKLGPGSSIDGLITAKNSVVELGSDSSLLVQIPTLASLVGISRFSIATMDTITSSCKDTLSRIDVLSPVHCKIGNNSRVVVGTGISGSLTVGNYSRINLESIITGPWSEGRQHFLVLDAIVGNTSVVSMQYGALRSILVLRVGSSVSILNFTFVHSNLSLEALKYNTHWRQLRDMVVPNEADPAGVYRLNIHADDFSSINNMSCIQQAKQQRTFTVRLKEGAGVASSIRDGTSSGRSSYLVFLGESRMGIELGKASIAVFEEIRNTIATMYPIHVGKGKILRVPNLGGCIRSWRILKKKDCII